MKEEIKNHMEKKINLLPDGFVGTGEVKDFKFKKILTGYSDYCYQVTFDDISNHFEVFKPKLTPLCIDFENRVYSETEFKEVYPKSNQFGVSAWSCRTFEKAIEKLKELENERRNKIKTTN